MPAGSAPRPVTGGQFRRPHLAVLTGPSVQTQGDAGDGLIACAMIGTLTRLTCRWLLLATLLLSCVAFSSGQDSGAATSKAQTLQKALTTAIAQQRKRQNATETVWAQVVEEAPAAALASGDGDVSTTGGWGPAAESGGGFLGSRRRRAAHALQPTPLSHTHLFIPSGPAGQCQDDITQFCEDVEPGEGRLAACLSKQLWKESRGETDDDGEASLLRNRVSAQHEDWNKYASEM